jgi:hypothetical protein
MKNQKPLACAAGVSGPATSCKPAAGPCGRQGPCRRAHAGKAERDREEGRGEAVGEGE